MVTVTVRVGLHPFYTDWNSDLESSRIPVAGSDWIQQTSQVQLRSSVNSGIGINWDWNSDIDYRPVQNGRNVIARRSQGRQGACVHHGIMATKGERTPGFN